MLTPYTLASRFLGMEEVHGATANPAILAMLQLDSRWPKDDSVPWCAAFVNYVCWLYGCERSKSLRARSWLWTGQSIPQLDAEVGFDVVVLMRGHGEQPGPEVLDAPGHVGFFAGFEGDYVKLLGGNQSDSVKIAGYPRRRILGVRRLQTISACTP